MTTARTTRRATPRILPPEFKVEARPGQQSALKFHCVVPEAQVGNCVLPLFAYWCGACNESFYIDHKPEFCPACGAHFN
jgi:rubrerythrin